MKLVVMTRIRDCDVVICAVLVRVDGEKNDLGNRFRKQLGRKEID